MKKLVLLLVISCFSVSTIHADKAPLIIKSEDVFTGSGNTQKLLDGEIKLKDYTADLINDHSAIQSKNKAYKGAIMIRNLFTKLIRFVEILMIPIGILYLLWAGLILIINRNNEEQFSQRVQQVIWMGAGFGLMAASFTLVDKMFFGVTGEVFREGAAGNFAQTARYEIQGLINFISTFAVAVAVAFLVFGAFRLIISGESENEAGQAKKTIMFSAIGIALISSAHAIANMLLRYNEHGSAGFTGLDASSIISFLAYWANIILGFVAFFAVIAVIWAGIQMITRIEDEEKINKAKKTIQFAIVGLVLAFSAWTLVRFFLLPV